MRIAHVYNWLDPANGGPPRVIAGLAAGQQRLGHEVVLISSDRADDATVRAFLAEHLDPLPPRTEIRPKSFWPLLTRKRLAAALAGVDVAHLHGIWPPVTLQASRVCRAMGIPYVLAPHGSLHAGALGEKWPRKQVGLWALGYAGLVRHAAALHLLNADEARIPWFVPRPAREEVIANGVFAERFETAPDVDARALIPGLGDGPFVLFLSRLHPGKGLDLLGDAFATVPDAHLVAVGPDQGGAAILRAAADRHGYADRLHLPGPRFGAEKRALLHAATAFCLPSRHEGFSVAILEAMACGRPVVISDTCHFPEVAEHAAGHVVPLDAEALGAALRATLADPAAAQAAGERGRALVRARYRWRALAARTIALYQSVSRPAG